MCIVPYSKHELSASHSRAHPQNTHWPVHGYSASYIEMHLLTNRMRLYTSPKCPRTLNCLDARGALESCGPGTGAFRTLELLDGTL